MKEITTNSIPGSTWGIPTGPSLAGDIAEVLQGQQNYSATHHSCTVCLKPAQGTLTASASLSPCSSTSPGLGSAGTAGTSTAPGKGDTAVMECFEKWSHTACCWHCVITTLPHVPLKAGLKARLLCAVEKHQPCCAHTRSELENSSELRCTSHGQVRCFLALFSSLPPCPVSAVQFTSVLRT